MNELANSFKQVFSKNTPTRDKLLFTIGGSAIAWYLLSITLIGFNQVKSTNSAKAKTTVNENSQNEPGKKNLGSPAVDSNGQAAPTPSTENPNGPTIGQATNMDLHDFMEFSITAISGTLATYLGMVLGLSQKQSQANAQSEITTMQKVAAWMYFLSLVYALALWGWAYFSEKNIAPVISTLGQSILGLFGGALAVMLNTENR
ncbi:MAG: hypothetical protein U0930_17105 [Pirellulales bacterium]